MSLRFVAPIAIFAVLIPVFFVGLKENPSELPSPYLNKKAPAFELPSLQEPSSTVSNRDYEGQVALVNVWATWCVGCRHEHDFLMTLSKTVDVPIYGLNWHDQREDALKWLDQLGNPYKKSAFDADGKVGIEWGVYGAPETFLIGADGTVLHKHLSPLTREVWERDFLPKIRAARGR